MTNALIILVLIIGLASSVTGWYTWLMARDTNTPAQVAARHMALTKKAAKLYREGRIEEADLLMEQAESLIPNDDKE